MLANRPKSKLQCKQLWMMIAEELLVVQMEDIVPQSGKQFTMKLRGSLEILLKSEQSCLTIEDILPLLPPKTKMKEIKKFLSSRITGRMDEINRLKKNIERKSKEIQKLQDSKKKKGKSHILVDPNQKCDLCKQTIFSEEFYVFSCKHSLHRYCIIRMFKQYEFSEAFQQKSIDRVRDLVLQVTNLD